MESLKNVIATAGDETGAALTARGDRVRGLIEANIERVSEVLDNRGGALAATLGERSAALGSLIDARVAQIGETLDSRLTGFESRLTESAEAAAIRLASSASTIEIAVEGRLSGFENRVTARIGEVTHNFAQRADGFANTLDDRLERINSTLDSRARQISETLVARTREMATAFHDGLTRWRRRSTAGCRRWATTCRPARTSLPRRSNRMMEINRALASGCSGRNESCDRANSLHPPHRHSSMLNERRHAERHARRPPGGPRQLLDTRAQSLVSAIDGAPRAGRGPRCKPALLEGFDAPRPDWRGPTAAPMPSAAGWTRNRTLLEGLEVRSAAFATGWRT